MQVDSGRCGRPVAQKKLDMMETCACFNQMGGKAMPQRMHAGRLCNAGTLFCRVKNTLYRTCGYVVLIFCPLKQPNSGAIFSPVLSQMIEGRPGQYGVTVITVEGGAIMYQRWR